MNIKTPNQIIDQVAQYYEIDKKHFIDASTRQKQQIADARQVCYYIVRTHTDLTLKQIASIFSRKHTTIIHAIKKVHSQMSNKLDNRMRNDINKLTNIIQPSNN